MTNKIFFHPETGKPLHRVPVGATIPAGTPFGWIEPPGTRHFGTLTRDFAIEPYSRPHFTAEPIAPPVPPPTEPRSLIRAAGPDGELCEVMALCSSGGWAGYWAGVAADGQVRAWRPYEIAVWEPVRVVPNGTGVLDESDKRPVVDSRGHWWGWDEFRDLWTRLRLGDSPDPPSLNRGTKAAIDRKYGPLRLAGGSAS